MPWPPSPSFFHKLTNLIFFSNALNLLTHINKGIGYEIVFIIFICTNRRCTYFFSSTHFYKPRDHTCHSLRANTLTSEEEKVQSWMTVPPRNAPLWYLGFLWWECPGPSQALSLMLGHFLGHEKSSTWKCTWKLTAVNAAKPLPAHRHLISRSLMNSTPVAHFQREWQTGLE